MGSTDITNKNATLRKWVKEHDLLNLAALCRRINYDRGSFSHWVEGHHDIGEEVICRLEDTFTHYGYATEKQ